MKRILAPIALFALSSVTAGCGDTVGGLLDGLLPGPADMTMGPDMVTPLYRLPSGVYKVSAAVTMLDDGCMVKPNDPDPNNGFPTGLMGSIWGITNDKAGGIAFGNTDKPDMPAVAQMMGADVGVPPQPAVGASCPGGGANPAQCASEPGAMAFNDNKGTLVRDNDINSAGLMCTFHRHIVNQVTLTADGKFTADYVRTDTKKMNCITNKTDCTTKWQWQLEYVKDFGK